MFQSAAVLWLAYLWHRRGPALPWLVGEALWGLSCFVMIGGTAALAVIAYRRRDLRAGLVLSALLWMTLAVLLMILT